MKVRNIEITHPDKILFPESKITKLDVVNYYEKFGSKMLPFLKGRPISLVRNPDGIDAQGFYQRHPAESFPNYIDRIKIKEKDGEKSLYIAVDDMDDLIYLSNLGVLEYHSWLSNVEDIEHPDILIFDLDPDKNADWKRVVEGALWLKQRLEKDKLKPAARVSGGKGIHVVASHKDKMTWKKSKDYARKIAEELESEDPGSYLTNMSKDKRKGKIFIDYLRNERGSTAVAPYSLRARPNAPVCMPVDWGDVNYSLKPNKYTLKDLMK